MSANYMILVLINVLIICNKCQGLAPPIVLWHGMGDSCCFPFSLGAFKDKLQSQLPGVYIKSLQIGDSIIADVENGYFKHPNEQIQIVCDIIKNDDQLVNGFNAIGFSQGSQFLRGLIQRCPEANVKNLISLGGQHQGVYGLPNCGSLSNVMCDYIRKLLNHAAYLSWVQKSLVQATYWHDPLHENEFKNFSSFLSDINNEQTINEDYKTRLLSLENFVLVKFEADTMVVPVESEWFGFYAPGQSVKIIPFDKTALYLEDRIGLKELNEDGRLHLLSTPGNHLKFEWEWFTSAILEPFLMDQQTTTAKTTLPFTTTPSTITTNSDATTSSSMTFLPTTTTPPDTTANFNSTPKF